MNQQTFYSFTINDYHMNLTKEEWEVLTSISHFKSANGDFKYSTQLEFIRNRFTVPTFYNFLKRKNNDPTDLDRWANRNICSKPSQVIYELLLLTDYFCFEELYVHCEKCLIDGEINNVEFYESHHPINSKLIFEYFDTISSENYLTLDPNDNLHILDKVLVKSSVMRYLLGKSHLLEQCFSELRKIFGIDFELSGCIIYGSFVQAILRDSHYDDIDFNGNLNEFFSLLTNQTITINSANKLVYTASHIKSGKKIQLNTYPLRVLTSKIDIPVTDLKLSEGSIYGKIKSWKQLLCGVCELGEKSIDNMFLMKYYGYEGGEVENDMDFRKNVFLRRINKYLSKGYDIKISFGNGEVFWEKDTEVTFKDIPKFISDKFESM